MGVTVIIPTFNEELHLARCLASVVDWAERVVVVDSFSTDATGDIAARFAGRGVELVRHRYEGPADQKNWALDHLELVSDWVLFLDADEIVTPPLRDAIVDVSSDPDHATRGYFINRRILWYGRWIRHGGWFPNWNLRLFRRGFARYEQRRVHEHMIVDGPAGYLDGWLDHDDRRDLTFSIAKHNRYSTAEAHEYVDGAARDGYGSLFSRDALSRKRWVKTRIWARLPGKGLWYFVWAYFVRLGFLDGGHGLRFHAMHAMYKQFDELKAWELRHYKEGAPDGAIAFIDRRRESARPAPASSAAVASAAPDLAGGTRD